MTPTLPLPPSPEQNSEGPSRRDFLQLAGTAAGGAWLAMHLPAIRAANLYAADAMTGAQAFETLTAEEARVLGAIAARCYPSDDTPGAEEAGVVYFMDRALGTFWTSFYPPVQGGLAALDGRVQSEHGSGDFADLADEQKDQLLAWLSSEQPGPAFILSLLAACGMFGDPALGGNRDKVGWELIGFEDRHVWEPPFGHYDREYTESGEGEQ